MTKLYFFISTARRARPSSRSRLLVVLDRRSEPRFDKVAALMTEGQHAVVVEALERFAAGTTGRQEKAAREAIESWRTIAGNTSRGPR